MWGTMPLADDKWPRAILMIAVLGCSSVVAGCLLPDALDVDLSGRGEAAWMYARGSVVLRADLPGDGSMCELHAAARGTASTLEPVMAAAATNAAWPEGGPNGGRFELRSNSGVPEGIAVHTTVSAGGQDLVEERPDPSFAEQWVQQVSLPRFESVEPGVAWILANSLSVHDTVAEFDDGHDQAIHDLLENKTIHAVLDCAGKRIPFRPAVNATGYLIEGPPSKGDAQAWTRIGNGGNRGISLAYLGVENDFKWVAERESSYFGKIGGDPGKAVVVTLDHPAGLETWLALPTTYGAAVGAGVGDIFMEYHGQAGEYRLSGSGVGTWLYLWQSLIILE